MEDLTSNRTDSRRSLIEEINHLSTIYGFRNRVLFNSFSDRTNFLFVGVKDMFEVVRKGRSELAQHMAVARVFSRLVCVIEYFRTTEEYLPFTKLLASKYPLRGCSYCKQKPCICPPRRDQSSELDLSSWTNQKDWSIIQWQFHLADVYGSVNQESSWDRMYGHLVSEVVEVINVNMSTHKLTQEELLDGYAKELADTFAWICGVATKMNVGVGTAVEMVYGQGCGACQQIPCKCGQLHVDFLDWDEFEDRYKDYPFPEFSPMASWIPEK